jgi:hypothetical protein
MEKYKRAFIRHHKLIYEQREKRFVHNYINSDLNGERRQKTLKRLKRALKGGSSSRAFGTSHKSSNSQLSLRRNNKKNQYYEEEEKQEQEVKKPKHKFRGPCDPLSSEPYVNVEIVKHGRDPNVSFSSGTIVKMACGKGYGLNMPENKTAKCVRGRWRPTKPTCSICKTPRQDFVAVLLSTLLQYLASSLSPRTASSNSPKSNFSPTPPPTRTNPSTRPSPWLTDKWWSSVVWKVTTSKVPAI